MEEEIAMKAQALVLGGRRGLLGQALTTVLQADDWQVATLDRDEGDLLDMHFLESSLERFQPAVIFNAIAWTDVETAEANEAGARLWNRTFPDSLARLIKGRPCHLIHYSTDLVFSGKQEWPYTEEDTPAPLSVLGQTKLEGEEALLQLVPAQTCIVRTARLFGPGKENFISRLLQKGRQKDSIAVIHDQIGSATCTRDLASWSLHLAKQHVCGLVHAANAGQASWCDMACEAVTLTATSCRVASISTAQAGQHALLPHYSALDCAKLTRLLGTPPRPWPQALRDYLFMDYLQPVSL